MSASRSNPYKLSAQNVPSEEKYAMARNSGLEREIVTFDRYCETCGISEYAACRVVLCQYADCGACLLRTIADSGR